MKRWIDEPRLEGEEDQAKALLERIEEPRAMPNARARVWARLERKPTPTRSLAWVALAGGLAGATAVGLVMIRPSPDRIRLEEAIAVEIGARPASVGNSVGDDETIRVGDDGHARLVGPGLGTVKLSASTGLTLIGIGRLALSEGRIDRDAVEPAWLSIDTGRYTVEASGRFWLARIGDDIEIDVQSGQARVSGRGLVQSISAGGHYRSAEVSAVVEPAAPPTPIAEVEPEPEAEPVRAHKRSVRSSPERIEAPAPVEPDAPKVVETPAIPSAPIAARAPTVPVTLDWGEKYRAAQKERVPERAIPMFDEIAQGPSAYAEVAGHQAARLVMRRGRCAEAIGRFQDLLRRFPSGSYVPEGQLNVIECRLVTGDLEGASRALDQFLAGNPGSERTAELVRMRDELERRKKK